MLITYLNLLPTLIAEVLNFMVTLHGCSDAFSHLWLCLQQRHEPQPHNLSEGSERLALGHSLWFLDPQLSAAVNSQRQACHFIFPFHSSTSAFPADWRTKALPVHARIQWSLFKHCVWDQVHNISKAGQKYLCSLLFTPRLFLGIYMTAFSIFFPLKYPTFQVAQDNPKLSNDMIK